MVVAPTALVSLVAPPALVLPGDGDGRWASAFAHPLISAMDPAAGRR